MRLKPLFDKVVIEQHNAEENSVVQGSMPRTAKRSQSKGRLWLLAKVC